MTWRQLVAYQEWVFEDLSKPGKTERYLMEQTEVFALKGATGGEWNPERWRVQVVRVQAEEPKPLKPLTKEEQNAVSKEIAQRLFSMVGQGELKIIKGGDVT